MEPQRRHRALLHCVACLVYKALNKLFEVVFVLMVFLSRGPRRRKRELWSHVNGCRILRIRLHSKKISAFTSAETRVGEAKILYEKVVSWSCGVVSRTGDG